MSAPFINTRTTMLRLVGDDANREWIQRHLVAAGLPTVKDWTPRGTVHARIHFGEWQVVCPAGCNGAEYADPDWPLFVCVECGEGPHKVTFPKNRAAIEALVVKVPFMKNRHYDPGDTLAVMKKMYAVNGVEVK